MPPSLEPLLPHVPAFLLVLFRMTGIFVFAPLFSSSLVPMPLKALLAMTLSFCVYPLVPPQLPVELSLMTMSVAVTSELLIGLVIGYGATLPLVAMQLGGLLMGQQLGLGLAQVFSPDFEEQTEVMGTLLYLTAVTIFIMLNGHHALLTVLVGSFENVPLGGYAPDQQLLQMIVGLLGSMMELGIRVAAPLLCMVFLETVAMGFVARTVPQLNVLSLGFPLRIIMGTILLIGTVGMMYQLLLPEARAAIVMLFQLFGVSD
ncbi:MAG: flagellar biosynthetic protein FliR [Phycisphaeraceae bacterium]